MELDGPVSNIQYMYICARRIYGGRDAHLLGPELDLRRVDGVVRGNGRLVAPRNAFESDRVHGRLRVRPPNGPMRVLEKNSAGIVREARVLENNGKVADDALAVWPDRAD